MEDLGPATDDQVILAWLQAEIESPRFQELIVGNPADLEMLGVVRQIAHQPDLDSAEENEARRDIIAGIRGFGRGEAIFAGLDDDIAWRHCRATPADVADMLYANHMADWIALAPTTLTVREGAGHVGRITTPGKVKVHAFAVAKGIHNALDVPHYPELICLRRPDERISIMEGHVRATAYVLEAHRLNAGVNIYVGTSPSAAHWHWL